MEGVGGGVTNEGAGCNFKGGEVDINGVENVEEYRPGGYHPVALGDVLGGRLIILQIKIMIFGFFFSDLFSTNQFQILSLKHNMFRDFARVTCSILCNIQTPGSEVV